MTIQFGRLPQQADLISHLGRNEHLAGTQAMPRASDQLPPLQRPVDPNDWEAQGAVGDPRQLKTMATRTTALTQPADTPGQAMQRYEQMGTDRVEQQRETMVQGAATLATAVAPPQAAQQLQSAMRLQRQQLAQAGGADQTGALADAQAFSQGYRMNLMDPTRLQALDAVAARQRSGASIFNPAV